MLILCFKTITKNEIIIQVKLSYIYLHILHINHICKNLTLSPQTIFLHKGTKYIYISNKLSWEREPGNSIEHWHGHLNVILETVTNLNERSMDFFWRRTGTVR